MYSKIKCVLLYRVSSKKDKGASSKLLFGQMSIRDNEVWYEQVGKELETDI